MIIKLLFILAGLAQGVVMMQLGGILYPLGLILCGFVGYYWAEFDKLEDYS